MIRFLPLLFVATTGLALVSCETTSSPQVVESAAPTPASPAVKPYPLKKCLVTGEPLMSKGHVVTEVYNGQEVKFCCEPCQQAFHLSPETYMAKL